MNHDLEPARRIGPWFQHRRRWGHGDLEGRRPLFHGHCHDYLTCGYLLRQVERRWRLVALLNHLVHQGRPVGFSNSRNGKQGLFTHLRNIALVLQGFLLLMVGLLSGFFCFRALLLVLLGLGAWFERGE